MDTHELGKKLLAGPKEEVCLLNVDEFGFITESVEAVHSSVRLALCNGGHPTTILYPDGLNSVFREEFAKMQLPHAEQTS